MSSRRTILGVLGAIPLAAGAASPASAHTSHPDLAELESLVAQRAERDEFSGTLLVASRRRIVVARAYGMANRVQQIPNRLDTLFGLASVTKSLTAIAVAQLVSQGKILLHSPIGTYLDGFPAEVANGVTVQHLLTHTSGLPDYTMDAAYRDGLVQWGSTTQVMDGILAIIQRSPLRSTPGTAYTYTNSGYHLLGTIVARVSGLSYFDYVQRHIFTPAGMTQAAFHTRPEVLASNRIARPYWMQPGGTRTDLTTTAFFGFAGGPASGAYATVHDLLAFAQALQADTLVPPAFTSLFTSGKQALPPAQPPSQTLSYGYGFLDAIVNNHRVFGHSGSGPGMATRLDVFPANGWTAAVLSNYDTTINPIVSLARQLITAR